MNKSPVWRLSNEINAMNPSQLYELARDLVSRHDRQADLLSMMIGAEFQEQDIARQNREERYVKIGQKVLKDMA
jgi:hypothetical protein